MTDRTARPVFEPAALERFDGADDLHVSPFREDGATYGTPTWIWNVLVDGRLFVRAYNGPRSRWYRAAMNQGAGRIRLADETLEVTFAAAPAELADHIDAAYREKYAGSPYLAPMLASGPRTAAVEISPAT